MKTFEQGGRAEANVCEAMFGPGETICTERRGPRCALAMANPFDLDGANTARFITGFEFDIEIAERSAIVHAARRILAPPSRLRTAEVVADVTRGVSASEEESSARRLWDAILLDAIDSGATYVRLEDGPEPVAVLFRIGGEFVLHAQLPTGLGAEMVRCLHVLVGRHPPHPRGPYDAEFHIRPRGQAFHVTFRPTGCGTRVLLFLVPGAVRSAPADPVQDGPRDERRRAALNRAWAAVGRRDLPEALGHCDAAEREALAMGPSGTSRLASALAERSRMLVEMGRAEDALAVNERAIAQWVATASSEAMQAPPGLSAAQVSAQLSYAWEERCYQALDLDRIEEAEAACERAIETIQSAFCAEDYCSLSSLSLLGWVRFRRARHEEAVACHTRALEGLEAFVGAQDLEVARMRRRLAEAWLALGEHATAGTLADQALATYERILGAEDPALGPCLLVAAASASDAGRFDTAEGLLRRAHAGYLREPRVDANAVAEVVLRLGEVQRTRKRNGSR